MLLEILGESRINVQNIYLTYQPYKNGTYFCASENFPNSQIPTLD